jgi:hypothetical protein
MRPLRSRLVQLLGVSRVQALRGVARPTRRLVSTPRTTVVWLGRLARRAPFVAGLVVALVGGLGAGTAYGFFSGSGSGSNVATIGSAGSVTVEAATGTPSSDLFPGGTADLTLTLDNPNSYPVTITGISQNGTVTASGGVGTCSTTGVLAPTQTGLAITVAKDSVVVVNIPDGASMDADSDSGCQGASFEVPVTITVQLP